MRRVADIKEGHRYISNFMIEQTGKNLISEWLFRREIGNGNIPSFRIGHRILLDLDKIDAWVEEQVKQSVEPKQPERLLRRAK